MSTLKENYNLTANTLSETCKKLDKSQQKIMILNSPNNPTGAVYTPKELKDIAKVCKENNIIVISDEIYAKVVFDGGAHSSIATYYPEGTIITSGLSKLFCAGGYRFGVALIPGNMSNLAEAF